MHPVLFSLNQFTVYTYGFFTALAAVASFIFAAKLARDSHIEEGIVTDLIFLMFLSGIFGARLFYVLQHQEYYQSAWLKALNIQEGGLVWYGGFITASSFGVLYSWLRRWPTGRLADLFSPVLALAHGIGRIGCFLNGCCYGREVAWLGHRHLPIQLAEALFLFFLSYYLTKIYFKNTRPGRVFFQYLFFYAIFRFMIEFYRGDQFPVNGLTWPQWTSVFLLAGLGLIYAFSMRNKK